MECGDGKGFGRRRVFGAAALAGGGAMLGGLMGRPARAQDQVTLVQPNGDYAKVPLRKERIRAGAVQSAIRYVTPANAKQELARNTKRVEELFDATQQYFMGGQDLLLFQEFAIQGWDRWDRSDLDKVALDLPGPEAEAIGAKCKEYGCYAAFGGYFRLPDWPGHIVTAYVLMNPEGEIEDIQWKARDSYGGAPNADYFTTTVYAVLDEYIERYGLDRVIPVARTDIGNITMSSVMREPELFRCMALKGAEIFLRSGLGGYSDYDGALTSRTNRAFTVFVTNAISPDNPGYLMDNGMLGDSAIYDARGERLGAADKFETAVVEALRIGELRQGRTIPDVYTALYQPIYEQYESRYPPGLYSDYQPSSLADASRYNRENRRW